MGVLHLLSSLSLLFILTLSPPTTTAQAPSPPPGFKCTGTKSTCNALVGYISPNTTTLARIQSLFKVTSLVSLLGVNGLPPTTPSNHTVLQNQTIRIPFPCRCSAGLGTSDNVPQYTVVKDDGLFHIASDVFAGLVTYPQIAAANKIKDPNLIFVGQNLRIPLPCSCDDVDGQPVVHYGHVVAPKSTFESMAKEFDTTPQTLMSLNGITDSKKLVAGQVLDVPLKACSTSGVQNISPDESDSVLAANGTYVYSADNCLKCSCEATNNYKLQCQPSGLKCNATPPAGTTPSPGKNGAWKVEQIGWSWALVLVSIQLLLLHRFL